MASRREVHGFLSRHGSDVARPIALGALNEGGPRLNAEGQPGSVRVLGVADRDGLGQVGDFKSFTARRLIDLLEDRRAETLLKQFRFGKERHRADREYQFWQEGSHPKQVRDEEMMRQKLEYIHLNPVTRGYVDDPVHWRYSSARNYAGQAGLIDVETAW